MLAIDNAMFFLSFPVNFGYALKFFVTSWSKSRASQPSRKHDKPETGTASIHYRTGTCLLPGRIGRDSAGSQRRCYPVAVGGRLSRVMASGASNGRRQKVIWRMVLLPVAPLTSGFEESTIHLEGRVFTSWVRINCVSSFIERRCVLSIDMQD